MDCHVAGAPRNDGHRMGCLGASAPRYGGQDINEGCNVADKVGAEQ